MLQGDKFFKSMGDKVNTEEAESKPLPEETDNIPNSQPTSSCFVTPKQRTSRPVSPSYSASCSATPAPGQPNAVSPTQVYVATSPRDVRKRQGDILDDSSLPPHERIGELPSLEELRTNPEKSLETVKRKISKEMEEYAQLEFDSERKIQEAIATADHFQ